MRVKIFARRMILWLSVFVGIVFSTLFLVDFYQKLMMHSDSLGHSSLALDEWSPIMKIPVNSDLLTRTNRTIQIITVLIGGTKLDYYRHALDTVRCYAQMRNYSFLIVPDTLFGEKCPQIDKFFRRHCVVAGLLERADYTLFIDSDMGVVNPRRTIDEFIDDRFDIQFYDRFFNLEITAGSYLVKNSNWSRNFLNGWADYENRLPNSFHGTDNGAIHAYLTELFFPHRRKEYDNCWAIYNKSQGYTDLFIFEACARAIMGASQQLGKILIRKKGTSWSRDQFLTNSKWSPDRDFILHGWKPNQLRSYSTSDLPISIRAGTSVIWYNPLAGPIHLSKCTRSNNTWSYDRNLVATADEVDSMLTRIFRRVERTRYRYLGKVNDQWN